MVFSFLSKNVEVDLYDFEFKENQHLPTYSIIYLREINNKLQVTLREKDPNLLLKVIEELEDYSEKLKIMSKDIKEKELKKFKDEYYAISDLGGKHLWTSNAEDLNEIAEGIKEVGFFHSLYCSYKNINHFYKGVFNSNEIKKYIEYQQEKYGKYEFFKKLIDAYKEYLFNNSRCSKDILPSPQEYRRLQTDVFNLDLSIRGELVYLSDSYLILYIGNVSNKEDWDEGPGMECASYGILIRDRNEFGVLDVVLSKDNGRIFCYKADRNFTKLGKQLNSPTFLEGFSYIKKLNL